MDEFTRQGFIGPIKFLSKSQCKALLLNALKFDHTTLPDWQKSLATTSDSIFRIATHPTILRHVKARLGNDILLWGASFIRRTPGQTHAWHNDIETSVNTGKTISVWIGIDHTSKDSSLKLISGSHLVKESIQEACHKKGWPRSLIPDEQILELAKQKNKTLNPDIVCELIYPALEDGDALFFDGWLWHASYNQTDKARIALLLQFATTETPIRIPDNNFPDWPFKYLLQPKPPCILVSGSDFYNVNRLVPAPYTITDSNSSFRLSTSVYSLELPLRSDGNDPWKPFMIFSGHTPHITHFTCHISALIPGHSSHPPQNHREEEILILLSGTAIVTLPDLQNLNIDPIVSLSQGDMVYYPAWFNHAITAQGDQPINYLMFKWFNPSIDTSDDQLSYKKYSIGAYFDDARSGIGFLSQVIFEGKTKCLNKLHAHVSTVQPGAGFESHTDAYDVAILVLEGQIETAGEQLTKNSIIFFTAGQAHGMFNPGLIPAKYLVLEFHGSPSEPEQRPKRKLIEKLQDPMSWKNKIKEILEAFMLLKK